ncbi:MAG: D-alanine--D-alanine ligase [Candidatus Kaiserbacteria bacterium]|nr:D-alanine--D-alanine ligase [Candidatus Kaiserbacteria bacterium]
MTRTIVGVLRGGTSNEYALSLKTGAAMLTALPEEKYDVRDILIDKSGTWYSRGTPATPARALTQIDVVLNALHGGVGEDGTVQRVLDRSGVPYAGSRSLPSALSLNKIRAREILERAGVRMPRGASFSVNAGLNTAEMSRSVFEQFGPPYIVKPPSDGAGHGIRIAASIVELPDVLGDILDSYGAALVEEYIRGDEVSAGVIDDFRGEELYVLPPAHVLKDAMHLTREMHENGSVQHVVPSRFTHIQKLNITEMARAAHKALQMLHFSRADMIVTPRTVYLLEVNTVPGLYAGASFPAMLNSVGSNVAEFLEHAIALARAQRA